MKHRSADLRRIYALGANFFLDSIYLLAFLVWVERIREGIGKGLLDNRGISAISEAEVEMEYLIFVYSIPKDQALTAFDRWLDFSRAGCKNPIVRIQQLNTDEERRIGAAFRHNKGINLFPLFTARVGKGCAFLHQDDGTT
jgi:hypothetical protein